MAYDKVVDSAKLDGKLTAIADAIRGKTGKSDPLTLDGMAQGVAEVFENGATSLIENMTSANHLFSSENERRHNEGIFDAFMSADLSNILRAQYMFQGNNWLTDFVLPTTLRPTLIHYMFQNCTTVKRVSGFDAMSVGVLTGIFDGCTSLVDAGTLNFSKVRYVTNAFRNCSALEEIRVSGDIGVNVSFADSPLSAESIQSIVDHLTDYSGTGTTMTVTLGAENLAKLTDEEKAIATQKGWTLV